MAGIREQFDMIKEAALATKLILNEDHIFLAHNNEHTASLVYNCDRRVMIVQLEDAQIKSDVDYVRFNTVIVDKINGNNVEEVLQSYDNSLAIYRIISDKLNYSENQDTVIENILLNTIIETNADGDFSNVLTTATSVFDLEVASVPNINI